MTTHLRVLNPWVSSPATTSPTPLRTEAATAAAAAAVAVAAAARTSSSAAMDAGRRVPAYLAPSPSPPNSSSPSSSPSLQVPTVNAGAAQPPPRLAASIGSAGEQRHASHRTHRAHPAHHSNGSHTAGGTSNSSSSTGSSSHDPGQPGKPSQQAPQSVHCDQPCHSDPHNAPPAEASAATAQSIIAGSQGPDRQFQQAVAAPLPRSPTTASPPRRYIHTSSARRSTNINANVHALSASSSAGTTHCPLGQQQTVMFSPSGGSAQLASSPRACSTPATTMVGSAVPTALAPAAPLEATAPSGPPTATAARAASAEIAGAGAALVEACRDASHTAVDNMAAAPLAVAGSISEAPASGHSIAPVASEPPSLQPALPDARAATPHSQHPLVRAHLHDPAHQQSPDPSADATRVAMPMGSSTACFPPATRSPAVAVLFAAALTSYLPESLLQHHQHQVQQRQQRQVMQQQQQQQQQQQLAGQQQQPPQPEQSDVCSQPSQQPSAPASRHLVQLHHRQPPTVSDARSTLQTSLAAGTGTTGVSTTVSIGSVVQALGSATPMEGPTRLGMAQHMPSTQQAVAVTAFNPDCNHIVTKQAPPAASDRQTSTLPAWLALPALPPLPNTPTTNVQPSTQHLQPPSAEHLNSTALDTAATGSSTNLTADHPPAIEIKWAPADARKKVEDHYVQAARDSNHVREQLERQKLFAACYNTPPAARLQKQLHKPSVQLDTPPQQPAQKSAHRHMQASSAKYAIQAHAKPGIVTLAQAPSAPSAAIGHTETSFVTTATITAVPSLPTYDESSMHTAETRPQPLAHTSRHCDAPPALNLDNEPLAAMAATAAAVSRAEQFADTSTMLTEGMAGPALLAEHAIKSRATATLLASTGTISAAAHPGPSAPSTVHHTSHLAPPLLSNAHRHYLAAPSASSHVQDSKRQPQEGLHAHFETQPLPQQHQQYQQYQQHQPPPFPNGYSHQAPPSHCSSHSSHRSMGPPINYIPATVLRDGFDGKEQPSTLGPRVCSLAGHFSLTTHAVPSGGGPSTNESDRIEAYLAFPPPPTSSILCKPLHTGIMRRQEVINRYFLRAPPSYESLEDFPPRQPQVGSGHVGLAATTAAPAAALSSRIIPAAAHASMGQGPQQGLLLEARERAQVASPASNGHEQHQQHKEHRQSPETAGTGVGASMRQTNRRAGMSTMSPIQEDDMVGDLDNVSDISEQFIDRRPPRRASDSFYHAGSLGSLFAFSLSMLPSYHSVDSRRSHWKPDHMASACTCCRRPFTLFTRKHHCRVCGDIFCNPCSMHRLRVSDDGSVTANGTLARVCDACFVHLLSE